MKDGESIFNDICLHQSSVLDNIIDNNAIADSSYLLTCGFSEELFLKLDKIKYKLWQIAKWMERHSFFKNAELDGESADLEGKSRSSRT